MSVRFGLLALLEVTDKGSDVEAFLVSGREIAGRRRR